MEEENIRREFWDICFEFTLRYIKEWQSFSLEGIIARLQRDQEFIRTARENLSHPSIRMNKAEEFKNEFRDYLVNNELAEKSGKDDINRETYRLTKKGKDAKKFENIYSRQEAQDEKMIFLTLVIAVGTIIAAIYYCTQINDYMQVHIIDSGYFFYFVSGVLFGLTSCIIYKLSIQKILKLMKRK